MKSSAFGDQWPGSMASLLASLQRACNFELSREARANLFPGSNAVWEQKRKYCSASADGAFAAFAVEAPGARPALAEALPSDDIDAIASELALAELDDRNGLHNLRRRFMWANHPDRRPDLPCGLANRRVAIANMLIDQALQSG